jgi:hypothetical protein
MLALIREMEMHDDQLGALVLRQERIKGEGEGAG